MLGPCCVVQHQLLLCDLQGSSEQGRDRPGARALLSTSVHLLLLSTFLCSNAMGHVALGDWPALLP